MPRSSSSRERSIIREGGSPISPVIRTMTSVPPAIAVICASTVVPVRTAYASRRDDGVSIGGSTGTSAASHRAAAPAPSSNENGDQARDDREPDGDLLRAERDGVLVRR